MTICPIELTKALIACPSITPKDEGAQILLGRELEKIGFHCHPMTFGDVPNLFARIGNGGKHLCYAGHTDVVPTGPLDKWNTPPFEPTVKDGVLYGRGASDMKGSVACFAAAVSMYIDKHGAPKDGSISMLITGDEEGPGVDGTVKVLEWMETEGHIPDVALVGEPTNPDHLAQEIKIGRRGSLTGWLTVRGKQGHVAYPHRCNNPVPRLVALLSVLTTAKLDDGNEFFQPSSLQVVDLKAGTGVDNIIPAAASAMFNIRYCNDWSGQSLEEHLRKLLDAVGVEYELKVKNGSQGFMTKPAKWANIVADAVEDVVGKRPEFTTSGGTSDARFIHHYCEVLDYGGINASIHQINENAKLSDLESLAVIYLRIIERYFA